MIDFLVTVVLSFAVILVALWVFRYLGVPVYRVEAINIKVLLQSVLNESATTADWDVFIAMPITQDAELDDIRVQCAMLEESTMTERHGLVFFSATGREQLTQLLSQVERKLISDSKIAPQNTEQKHDR